MAIYLDYAAATPLDKAVAAAMAPYQRDKFYNPSATYQAAREVRQAVEAARQQVAKQLSVKSNTITFTAGITEAHNLLIQTVARQYPGHHIIISALEHESVVGPAQLAAELWNVEVTLAPVKADGRLDMSALERLIRNDTVLISVIHAHNELGVIQKLASVAAIRDQALEERRRVSQDNIPLIVHTDAAQSPNALAVNCHQLGVDALTLSAAKLYGPKQVAAMYAKPWVPLRPFIAGGDQEHGWRAGTENVPGIVGLAAALELARSCREQEHQRLRALQDNLERQLDKLPGSHIHARQAPRLPNITSVRFAGVDAEQLAMELDERGIQLGLGSACNAAHDAPSASLLAIGLNEAQARSTIRIAMGRGTSQNDIDQLVSCLKELITS